MRTIKNAKVINVAETKHTVSYFYDSVKKRFGAVGSYMNHGFEADMEIIVDAGLYADEYDAIINKIIAE